MNLRPYHASATAPQEAVRLRANYADAYTAMGVSLKELGRKAEAQACFQVVTRLRPGCALSLGNLAGIYYEQVLPSSVRWQKFGGQVSLAGVEFRIVLWFPAIIGSLPAVWAVVYTAGFGIRRAWRIAEVSPMVSQSQATLRADVQLLR